MNMNNTARVASRSRLVAERVSAAPRPDASATVFDINTGMPLTRAAARSMSTGVIQTAIDKAVESLPGRRVSAHGASPARPQSGTPLDSLEVVWLLAKFEKLFDKPLVDLTKVSAQRWSTIEAVAGIIHESMGAQQ